MKKFPDPGRGTVRCAVSSFGLALAALFVLSAAPGQRAEALSLINSGAVPAAKQVSDGLTTEVRGGHGGGRRWRRRWRWPLRWWRRFPRRRRRRRFHGGGGGAAIHGGSFRSGGPVFHGSAIRSAPVFRGSGIRHAGFAFRHHHFHRRFFYGASYYPYDDYPYYYAYRRCPVIWTHFGPRRICHYRHWRHHHWRHHHWHHHHWRHHHWRHHHRFY